MNRGPDPVRSRRELRFRVYESPFGLLALVVDAVGRLERIAFLGDSPPEDALAVHHDPDRVRLIERPDCASEVARQLDEYFTGERRAFDLELAPEGTEFQRRVWNLLMKIPPGQTRTYGEMARELGRPGAARAVGRANATNPWPIVVPCHRLVGTDGRLTGFAGGLAFKRSLLELERAEGWTPRG